MPHPTSNALAGCLMRRCASYQAYAANPASNARAGCLMRRCASYQAYAAVKCCPQQVG
ncbi:hypothetical protein [Escherichia marmotae]|uniref:hypothetical protein n=1 Tax=Escherichia marmotae TaxID=1499973 RepID=UPI0015F18BAC|nr:hypothetical protein [Escherichia marmotae]